MLKFTDNPSMLPPHVNSIEELTGPWWVAHTKSRFEKALVHDLGRQGIGYYLPMVDRVRISGGRKRRLMLPLFTSYVFFCGDTESRYAALATNRVCQVIPVPNQSRFIEEMQAINRVLASTGALDLFPFAAVGRRCRVTAGPFQGVVGTVETRDNQSRFVLGVSILGQGASLEIDADLLESAES